MEEECDDDDTDDADDDGIERGEETLLEVERAAGVPTVRVIE